MNYNVLTSAEHEVLSSQDQEPIVEEISSPTKEENESFRQVDVDSIDNINKEIRGERTIS